MKGKKLFVLFYLKLVGYSISERSMSSILCLLLLLWIPAIVEPYSYCESGTQRVKCVHGTCQNDSTVSSTRCLCDRGWGGPSCDACGGRVK